MSARTILKHVYENGGLTEYQYNRIDRVLKERERPHGSWEGKPERKQLITRRCTRCGERGAVGNFCWWCGADMSKLPANYQQIKEGEASDKTHDNR